MNLADLLQSLPPNTPIDIATARGLWLVFDAEYLAELNNAQSDQKTHRAVPTELTDGRFALCADLLTEISGGIFALQFSRLNQSNFANVEVLDSATVQPLIPVIEAEL
jgi:hypothetical protein